MHVVEVFITTSSSIKLALCMVEEEEEEEEEEDTCKPTTKSSRTGVFHCSCQTLGPSYCRLLLLDNRSSSLGHTLA